MNITKSQENESTFASVLSATIKRTDLIGQFFFDVGEDLFSRDVSVQVSSAQMSLTSVFGMGTGGTSS